MDMSNEMVKWYEFEQFMNMNNFQLSKLYRMESNGDNELTVLVMRDFPVKKRFRERFYAETIDQLIDAIQNRTREVDL